MRDSPCRPCHAKGESYIGCHTTCTKEEYLEYNKWIEQQREERHKRQIVVDGLYATQRKTSAIKRRKDPQ